MPIVLGEQKPAGLPVVKRQRLGETFIGMIVRTQQRAILRDGEPVYNDRGKPRQELVVTCITLPGTTAAAGIGDDIKVPAPCDRVRLILRGRGYSDWIEQLRELGGPLQVGDVVTTTTEWAQAYDAAGKPKGPKMTTQAEVDAQPRSTTIGIYGSLTLRRATPQEANYVSLAEAAYHETTERITLAEQPAPDDDLL